MTILAATAVRSLCAAEAITNALSAEEKIIKEGKLELPSAWRIPRPVPPAVHIAKGLWWNFFGLSDAMTELGGALVSSSYHAREGSSALRYFVSTWQDLAKCNLVMLANVDAEAVNPTRRLLLEEYVRNGGALFVFGGPFAFESGGYPGTALDRLLPFDMPSKYRLRATKKLRTGDGAKGILPDDLCWSMEPSVFWFHDVRPRAGARVLAMADDKPVLAAWQVGKGRVAAFAVTVQGDPGTNELAFWEWNDMPRLVASVARWLIQGQGENLPPVASGETERLLREILSLAMGGDDQKRARLLQTLRSRCNDKACARNLLYAVGSCDLTPDRGLVMAIARTVRPFADGSFAQEANDLIASKDVGKAALGLQVLGMSRAPNASSVILEFLKKGTGVFTPAGKADQAGAGIDDLRMGFHHAYFGEDDLLKLAAVVALGDLGDAAQLEKLKHTTDAFTVSAGNAATADNAAMADITDIRENIFQQSLAARVRLGDRSALGAYLAELLKNQAEMEDMQNTFDKMLKNTTDKAFLRKLKMAAQRMPLMRQREALCMEMLCRMPVSLYPDFGAELVKRNDEVTLPMAMTVLVPRPGVVIAPETAKSLIPMLTDCKIPGLRLLALQILRNAGGTDSDKLLSGALLKLARSEDAADVRFAVRHVNRIPPAERGAVVSAALQRKEPDIRRIARCSFPLLPEQERQSLANQP